VRRLPKGNSYTPATKRVWRSWEKASATWDDGDWVFAERLIGDVNRLDSVQDDRQRRLLADSIERGERRLGLARRPPPPEPEVEAPPQPRDVALRIPDLGLLYAEPEQQFVWPPQDPEPFPTLGPAVVQWIEARLHHGPGDLRGEPARIGDSMLAFIARAYEVFPPGHEREGQRRFSEADLVLRKGANKTETAAWLMIAEMHPDAPVVFDRWTDDGTPVGKGRVDPRVFLLAFSEEQSSALTYNAVRSVLKESPCVSGDFRITDQFIERSDGSGRCEPCTGSPSSRDGERTTTNVFDEGHRLVGRTREAAEVMTNNLPKRADSFNLGTTTAWLPGEDSLAERNDKRARKKQPEDVLYWHRAARDGRDLRQRDDALAAVCEASPPDVWEWTDKDAVMGLWRACLDRGELAYFERVWCCRSVSSSTQAFDMAKIRRAGVPRLSMRPTQKWVLGMDGSYGGQRGGDNTAIIACSLDEPVALKVVGIYEPEWSDEAGEYRIDVAAVDRDLRQAWRDLRVVGMLMDPSGWVGQAERWQRDLKTIESFDRKHLPRAVWMYAKAWGAGELRFEFDERFYAEHSNALHKKSGGVNPDGTPAWTITKSSDRTKKIDSCVAAALAYEKRSRYAKAHPRSGTSDRTTVYMR
jgi:hypothetical protein